MESLSKLTQTALPSPTEMAALDARAIASGVTGLELMERAGKEIYAILKHYFPRIGSRDARVVILCGSGNNGGDGAVIGRLMRRERIFPELIVVGADRYSKEIEFQLEGFCGEQNTVKVYPAPQAPIGALRTVACPPEALQQTLRSADIIIDALMGTGQRAAPSGNVGQMIHALNAVRAEPNAKHQRIVSVDIPSGVNGDTGEILGDAVFADLTVTIEAVKRGMLQFPGRNACGVLEVVPIGIRCDNGAEFELITSRTVPRLPMRAGGAHKGDAGRVLVVGGSIDMPGAPNLSALSALRIGAGLVTQVVLEGGTNFGRIPELLYCTVPSENGCISTKSLPTLNKALEHANSLILGPGIGLSASSETVVTELLKQRLDRNIPLVLDADGLTIAAKNLELLRGAIVTPHPGEAARLLAGSTREVQRDRYSSARELAARSGAVVVLKGAGSIVYAGNRGFVNSSGNSWMATAGSGDVLAGVVGGLIAQGAPLLDAAKLGVFMHGMAGDIASQASGGPIIASDITNQLSHAFGKIHAT